MQNLSERDLDLIQRAKYTFEKNTLIPREDETNGWGDYPACCPSWKVYRGVWNWDSCFHAMGIARYNPEFSKNQIQFFFDSQREDGCFIDCTELNGSYSDTISKPPVIFWAVKRIYDATHDMEWLRDKYPRLQKGLAFWNEKRCEGGLYFYSVDSESNKAQAPKWESGWDNSPRFDGDITSDIWSVDLCCYMVIAYESMAYIAETLGHSDDAAVYMKERDALAQRIESTLFDHNAGGYSDCFKDGRGFTDIFSPASFMPLFAGISSGEHAAAMAKMAEDENKFFPLMPAVSYDSPAYTPDQYWRGPCWINIAAMAIMGLYRMGYTKLALEYRERILDMCANEKRGLFEYYNSRTGEGLGAIDYGWTATFVMELIFMEEAF